MKKTYPLILVFILIFTLNVNAQNELGKKEIWLSGSSLLNSNVGIQYKSSLSENWYISLSGLNMQVETTNNESSSTLNYPQNFLSIYANFSIGLERRHQISDRFIFLYGPEILFGYQYSHEKTEDPSIPIDYRKNSIETISGGGGIVLGCIFQIKNGFYIGAELHPSIVYKDTFHSNYSSYISDMYEYHNSYWDYDMKLSSANISLIYRWDKK